MGGRMFIFDAMFTIIPIIVGLGFVLTFTLMFSSKARAWFLSKQVKAVNYVVEDNKEELKNIADTGADISVDAIKRTTKAVASGIGEEIINLRRATEEHKDDLKEMADLNAEINEDAVRKTAAAAAEGFNNGNATCFCSYCGAKIAADSVFCRKCGKKQTQ